MEGVAFQMPSAGSENVDLDYNTVTKGAGMMQV
jgi:hypothetical protein